MNKFGDRLKNAGTIHNELNMNGNNIVGLPTYTGDLTGDGDAVSHRILLDVMERLNNKEQNGTGTNRMTGDSIMNIIYSLSNRRSFCSYRYHFVLYYSTFP